MFHWPIYAHSLLVWPGHCPPSCYGLNICAPLPCPKDAQGSLSLGSPNGMGGSLRGNWVMRVEPRMGLVGRREPAPPLSSLPDENSGKRQTCAHQEAGAPQNPTALAPLLTLPSLQTVTHECLLSEPPGSMTLLLQRPEMTETAYIWIHSPARGCPACYSTQPPLLFLYL